MPISTGWINFTLIDTGGIEPESDNIILKSMREQAEIAIESSGRHPVHDGCQTGNG